MKSKVVLLNLDNYELENVYLKIKKGFELLGGVSKFVDKDDKLLLKVNMLEGAEPSKAITTNPAILDGVIRTLKENDINNIKYGDSPGSPLHKIDQSLKLCGFLDVAEKYNIEYGAFDEHTKVSFEEGKVSKSFELCNAILEADKIIEICKMKTHALENITGAVKNQYGCIYGAYKAVGHKNYPSSSKFAEMLVDLNKKVNVKLHIMDGVVAMEGNGPASGTPISMNVILMSTDPVALDTVFCKLIYLNPEYVPTCVIGAKNNLGVMDINEIEILTEGGVLDIASAIKMYGNPKFDVRREERKFWNMPIIGPIINRMLGAKKDRPVVDKDLCIGCGICEKACPVEGKAVISGNGKKAEYNYKKCIRCYCCQEMCPKKAIHKE